MVKPKSLKRFKDFSKPQMGLFVLIFACVGGYLLLTSSAVNLSKVWDTDTGLNGGTLSSTTVSGSGTAAKLQLSATGGSSLPAATVFITTSGSDSNSCSLASPCASLGRGYTVAANGAVISVGPGTYAAQTVSGTKSSPGVIFNMDPATHISGLTVHANWVEFRNGIVDNYGWWREATSPIPSHVIFRNITATNANFDGGDTISIIGGSIGNYAAPSPGNGSDTLLEGDINPLTNFVIDGVDVHDITHVGASDHFAAIRIDVGVSFVTIKNSKFRNITANSSIIFITNVLTDPGDPHDITFENNFIGDATSDPGGGSFYTIATQNPVIQTCTNLVFRYNSFVSSGARLPCTSFSGVSFVGNTGVNPVGPSSHCPTGGVTYSHNVWTNGACGGTDKNVASIGYVNSSTASLDLHLTTGSPAIDAGDPASCPALDIDGQTRPAGAACDAGADEFGATAPGGSGTYSTSGTAVYSFDAGQSVSWTSLSDSQTTPAGTSAVLEARSSSDNSTWSGWVSAASVAGLTANRYIQVRATLGTTNTSQTPSIDSISLGYASTVTSVPGDANNDGHVNIVDVSILLSNFGTSASSCDFNHDGVVNIIDVSILLSNFGT